MRGVGGPLPLWRGLLTTVDIYVQSFNGTERLENFCVSYP
jgi:hypothetical protein